MKLIYVGRLDEEKGVNYIIEAISTLLSDFSSITLDIFGNGNLKPQIESWASNDSRITYHGFQKKETVVDAWNTMDFCLMPSCFLETFGLSALDSLGAGVPVLAPNKGGLSSFVFEEFTLEEVSAHHIATMIQKAYTVFCDEQLMNNYRARAKATYANFSLDIWIERIQTLGISKRVTLISDYELNHGGLESLIGEMYDTLVSQGFEVTFLAGTSKQLSSNQRYRGLLKTMANFGFLKKLFTLKNNTQLFWRHSVHRQIGWLPLFFAPSGVSHRIMIHDFGLLHPFPSCVYSESQIEKSKTFGGRISEGVKYSSLIWVPLLIAKWMSMKILWSCIGYKKMRIQVPSQYLENHVKARIGSRCEVMTLPHFVLGNE